MNTRFISRLARGTAARRTRRAARSRRTPRSIDPVTPAGTEFIIFITSMMQTVVSGSTRLPRSTNGAAPGRLGAVEGAEHRGRDRSSPSSAGGCARRWRGCAAGARTLRERRRASRAPLPRLRTWSENPSVSIRSSSRSDSSMMRRISRTSSSVSAISRLAVPAPNVLITSAIADAGAGLGSRLGKRGDRAATGGRTAVGHACRGRSPTRRPGGRRSGARRGGPRSTRRRERVRVQAAARRGARPATSTRTAPRPRGVGHVLDLLVADVLADDLAGDLADEEIVRGHLAADDREAEPPARVDRDHARVAADRVAREHHARDRGVDHQLDGHAHRRRSSAALPSRVR